MSLPFFIAKKYTISKKDSRFITFISTISVIGIALGVATLIIALSILDGFENTLTNKIIDFDSHIQISSYRTILPDYHRILPIIKNDLGSYRKSVKPYASRLAIVSSKYAKEGISIKGIIPSENWKGVKHDIVSGSFYLRDSLGLPSIVIGQKLANKLFAKVGDRITVFALSNDAIPTPDNPPNIMRFVVTGIFESGMAEYDDLYAYIKLNKAQQLFNLGDNITGYDIQLNNISKIDSLAGYLSSQLRYPHYVRTIYQIHRNIFTWIDLQKKPIPIVLGLIIIVAVFNIIGTLLMIVLEKTKAVGILKSMGAGSKQIISIFMYQAVFLAIAGILAGNIIAFILTYAQLHYKIISIPSSVYFMSTVPILITLKTFIEVSLLTFGLCIIASFIPSYIASKIQPVNSLRFN